MKKEKKEDNLTYSEIEDFVKKYFTVYTEGLLKKNIYYCEICFVDILKGNYIFSNNNKEADTYGAVEISCDENDKFKIIYSFSDFSRVLFNNQFEPILKDIVKKIQYIVKHECYHILQFLWVKNHTSNWEKSIFELEFYNINTPYDRREHEIEAKKASLNDSNLKLFENYLSQFVF